MRPLFVVLLFLTFVVSNAQSDTTNAFLGLTKKQLYKKLGKPYIKKNTTKGQALIYETPGIMEIHSSPYNTDGDNHRIIQQEVITTFYLNKKGRVYAMENEMPRMPDH